jgi:hypothetical protein
MLLPHELAPDLESLYSYHVQQLFDDPDLPQAGDLLSMVKRCPYNRIAIEIKAMRAVLALGNYTHDDDTLLNTPRGKKTVAEWVNGNFESMKGDLYQAAGKMFRQCYPIGSSVAEIVFGGDRSEWRLAKVKVLKRSNYTFAGYGGEWDRIIYNSTYKAPFPVPRQKLLHIYIPDIDEPEHPNGDPQAARAYPYYQARKLALSRWSIKLGRDARGVWVIKSDSNKTSTKRDEFGNVVRASDGNPVKTSSLEQAVDAAKKIEDGDVFGTDKQNDVNYYASTSSGTSDFNVAIQAYANDIFIAYGIPKTILGEGSASLGQSGLNYGHRLILDVQIEAMVEMMRSQLIEQIVKPLLNANFGDRFKDNYGRFVSDKFLDPSMSATRVSNLMSAILQGIIDGNDLEAINRIRLDCGLTAITAAEWGEMLMNKLIAEQQAAASQYP